MIIKMETQLRESAPISALRLKQFLENIPGGAELHFYQDPGDDYRVKTPTLTVTAKWQEIKDESEPVG